MEVLCEECEALLFERTQLGKNIFAVNPHGRKRPDFIQEGEKQIINCDECGHRNIFQEMPTPEGQGVNLSRVKNL